MHDPERLLRTPRLDLVAATLAHVDAELAGRAALGGLLGAAVPEGWPPGEYDRDAQMYFRRRLAGEGPALVGWLTWYALTRHDDGRRDALIGAAGYFGPPSAASVEIGFSVVPAAQRRGYAVEIAEALVAQAFLNPSVDAVVAHTVEANVASIRTLLRAGFLPSGPGADPGTLAFRCERPRTGR